MPCAESLGTFTVLASSYYLNPLGREASSAAILEDLRSLPHLERERWDRWSWRVLDIGGETGTVFLEFRPGSALGEKPAQ